MLVLRLRRGMPVKKKTRTGLYFDLTGSLYFDPEEAEGKSGRLVALTDAEVVLVQRRLHEALLEAAARIVWRRRRRR